jgi:hypothetical protein
MISRRWSSGASMEKINFSEAKNILPCSLLRF